MRYLLLVALLVCWASTVDAIRPINICMITDMQNLTLAEGEDAAMTHAIGAVTWASTGSNCDVVIFGGDNVDGFYWGEDPWCLAQPGPGDPDCSEYHNDYLDLDCDTDGCGDAQAAACTYGTAGNFCEWERAAYLVNIPRVANKPFIVIYGNHDNDWKGITKDRCMRTGSVFNSYFGKDYMSDDFETSGYFEESVPCAESSTGLAEQAIASYHVLNIEGFKLLFLNFPWYPPSMSAWNSVSPYSGSTSRVVQFMHDTMALYAKIPTVALAHTMSSESCPDAAYEHYGAWCNNLSGWYSFWTGFTVKDEFLSKYPEIFLTLGGHIRDLMAAVTKLPHRVVAAAHDYTDSITNAPAWQQNTDNGGGGVVTVYRVDPISGVVSSLGYSPTEDDYIGLYDNAGGSAFHHFVGLCGETRFDIPKGVCPVATDSKMVVR